jgi:SAM-dependent methyltransferase
MNEVVGHLTNPYDEVLYPSRTLPQTHPSRLATVAFLRGMQPASIGRCRVLELGCGTAANLIPMAFHHPESEFVGLDLAERPIAFGRSNISALGLHNITLHLMDLCEANPERLGCFDYIIAHGVYSWVPQSVRERILAISREMLNPQGVAYISYNAYPGDELLETAHPGNGSKSVADQQSNDAAILEGALAQLYHQGFLLLSICPTKVINRVSERPAASQLARFQLKSGQPATNPLHTSFHFSDPFARQLLLLLDGTRDRETLAHDLVEFSKSKEGAIFENGVAVDSLEQLSGAIERLPCGLQALAREGMLVG